MRVSPGKADFRLPVRHFCVSCGPAAIRRHQHDGDPAGVIDVGSPASACLRSHKTTPVISSIKARAKRPVPTRTPPPEEKYARKRQTAVSIPETAVKLTRVV